MATITSSIGSNARDFSSLQAWADSIPTDLVAAGNSYVGLLYNDSEFLEANAKLNLSGKTTDINNRITLKPAPGQGFRDNPNRLNVPLWYNPANGVALKYTGSGNQININVPYTIIDGLQLNAPYPAGAGGAGIELRNLIALGNPTNNVTVSACGVSNGASLINSLVIVNNAGSGSAVQMTNGGFVQSCTLVRPSNFGVPSSFATYNNWGANVVKNTAMFGFGGREWSPANYASGTSNNATDWTQAPGSTNNLLSQTYADQFVNSTNDFRLKAGSTLIGKGVNASATIGSADILGTVRQATWDIGAFAMLLPATKLLITGPSLGQVGVASAPYTIQPDGSIPADVHVTLSDGGGGGTFNPATLTLLAGAVASAQATYTPGLAGDKQISLTSDSALTNPASLLYKAANPATKLTITPPTGKGRAGVQSANFKVELDGMPSSNVNLTITDDLGTGVFTPSTLVLSQTVLSGTFQYKGAAAGLRTITVNNDKGFPVATATFFLKDPIVLKPTPSSEGLLVKSIGTGKDFPTVKDFADYIRTLDLDSLKTSVLGEVYENQAAQSGINFTPIVVTPNYSVIVQPVPGADVATLDHGEPLDYNSAEGIEWSIGSYFKMNRGMIIQGFKLAIDGNNYISASGSANPANVPWLRRNRIKGTTTNHYVNAGEYGCPVLFTDNVAIMDNGTGSAGVSAIVSASSYFTALRNTFVRRGNSTAKALIVSNSQGVASKTIIGDNVFIGFDSAPITGIELLTAAQAYNNFLSTALAAPKAGFTAPVLPLVRDVLTDYRPDDAGALINAASAQAMDTLDIYGINRGGNPDAGATQGSIVNALPQVTITSQGVRGSKVSVSGTTRFAPSSGTITFLPDDLNPAGAAAAGPFPVTIGTGTFTFEKDGIHFGNYKVPVVKLTNEAGTNVSQTGGEIFSIIPISAKITAGQASPTVGNAAAVSIATTRFDNDTVSIDGDVDLQGDKAGTVNVYLDSIVDPNVTMGPFKANIIGNKWAVQVKNVKGGFKVRVVGNANAKPVTTVTGNPKKIIEYKGKITLPTR
jgi:hypothetical protein